MKYLKLFENINYLNNDYYKKSLTENEFNTILNEYCKDFDFNDKILVRGDNSLDGDYYYVNPKNRKVNYNYRKNLPIHLIFMDGEKWKNHPIKKSSIDFTLNTKIYDTIKNGYGNLYRVIPFDGGKFGMPLKSGVGSYNLKLAGLVFRSSGLPSLYTYLRNKHNKHFDETRNINTFINNLDKLYMTDMGDELSKKLQDRGETFKEYMSYAFSPPFYKFFDYSGLMEFDDGKKYGSAAWTDVPVLLKKMT